MPEPHVNLGVMTIGERCPRCSDSAQNFCRLLLLERYGLSEILCLSVGSVVGKIFSGWIFTPTLSVLLPKSPVIIFSWSSDVENESTASGNLELDRQSVQWSPKLMPMPFLAPAFQVIFHASLKHRAEQKRTRGFLCFLTLCILNISLSLSAETVACWSSYDLFKMLMYGASTSNLPRAFHSAL